HRHERVHAMTVSGRQRAGLARISAVAVSEHKAAAPASASIRIAVLTVSDTRTLETDQGGALVEQMVREAGFTVAHRDLCRDEPAALRERLTAWAPARPPGASTAEPSTALDAILITGGTG